jgi:hypothetical protein
MSLPCGKKCVVVIGVPMVQQYVTLKSATSVTLCGISGFHHFVDEVIPFLGVNTRRCTQKSNGMTVV